MQVDIWSDVVCPWCYVGKRRFEAALAQFAHRDEVTVRWRAFELDPHGPPEREGSQAVHLARKYGMTVDQAVAAQDRLARVAAEDGLDMRFDRTRPGNTVTAHRVLHLAAERGVQDAVKERLMRGYFTEGEPIGDPATVARLAAEAGLDEADALDVAKGEAYLAEVRADEEAAMDIGITGVPFFLVDGRFGISGAQPVDVVLRTLERAWARANPVEVVADPGEACTDDSCGIV